MRPLRILSLHKQIGKQSLLIEWLHFSKLEHMITASIFFGKINNALIPGSPHTSEFQAAAKV